MTGFSADNLSAGYGGKPVFSGLSFRVEAGRMTGILGANGCGKTTLLKAVCGILPSSGSRRLDGEDLARLSVRRTALRCSYIPQRSGIAIDISALDVVLMGFNPQLGLLRRPCAAMKETARRTLDIVGLSGMEDKNYLHLSEGQKQLCILARTLVSDARLLLLDEPESALDFRHRYNVLETLRHHIREGNRMAIVALHDPALALGFCDELLLLKERGRPVLLRPASDAPEEMERHLCDLYGPVSLTRCQNRRGKTHLIMLREEEANR